MNINFSLIPGLDNDLEWRLRKLLTRVSVSDVAETMGCTSRDKPAQLSDLFLHYSQITKFASYVNQPVLSKGRGRASISTYA